MKLYCVSINAYLEIWRFRGEEGQQLVHQRDTKEREREIMKRSGKLVPRMNNFYVEMDSSFMHSMVSYTVSSVFFTFILQNFSSS